MADSEMYEIRRPTLTHRCTIDERGSFHKRVSTSIIGDMMRSRYVGKESGPCPGELRKMMRSEHGVRFSYWKAWRSREIAMNYAKCSSLSSYTLLPSYLHQVVIANPHSIVAVETVYHEARGQRFKDLFCAGRVL